MPSPAQSIIDEACHEEGWPAASALATLIVQQRLPGAPEHNLVYKRVIALTLLAAADSNGRMSYSDVLRCMSEVARRSQVTLLFQDGLRMAALAHWKLVLAIDERGLARLARQCEYLVSEALGSASQARHLLATCKEDSWDAPLAFDDHADHIYSDSDFHGMRSGQTNPYDIFTEAGPIGEDDMGLPEDLTALLTGPSIYETDDLADNLDQLGITGPNSFDMPEGEDGSGFARTPQRFSIPSVDALYNEGHDDSEGDYESYLCKPGWEDADDSGTASHLFGKPRGEADDRLAGPALRRAILAVQCTTTPNSLGDLIAACYSFDCARDLIVTIVDVGDMPSLPREQLDEMTLLMWAAARRSWPLQTLRDIALTFDEPTSQILVEQLIDEQTMREARGGAAHSPDADHLHEIRLTRLEGPVWQPTTAETIDRFDQVVRSNSDRFRNHMALAMTERLIAERGARSIADLLPPCVDWRSACALAAGLSLRAGLTDKQRAGSRFALPVLLHAYWGDSLGQLLHASHADREPDLRLQIGSKIHGAGQLAPTAWRAFCAQVDVGPTGSLHATVAQIQASLSGSTSSDSTRLRAERRTAQVKETERRAKAARERAEELTRKRQQMEDETAVMAVQVERAEQAKADAEQKAIARIEHDRSILSAKLERLKASPSASVTIPDMTGASRQAPVHRPSWLHVHRFKQLHLAERKLAGGETVQVSAQRCRCGLDREVIRRASVVGHRTVQIREIAAGSHDHYVVRDKQVKQSDSASPYTDLVASKSPNFSEACRAADP
jgi:hypothetical protein